MPSKLSQASAILIVNKTKGIELGQINSTTNYLPFYLSKFKLLTRVDLNNNILDTQGSNLLDKSKLSNTKLITPFPPLLVPSLKALMPVDLILLTIKIKALKKVSITTPTSITILSPQKSILGFNKKKKKQKKEIDIVKVMLPRDNIPKDIIQQ